MRVSQDAVAEILRLPLSGSLRMTTLVWVLGMGVAVGGWCGDSVWLCAVTILAVRGDKLFDDNSTADGCDHNFLGDGAITTRLQV